MLYGLAVIYAAFEKVVKKGEGKQIKCSGNKQHKKSLSRFKTVSKNETEKCIAYVYNASHSAHTKEKIIYHRTDSSTFFSLPQINRDFLSKCR